MLIGTAGSELFIVNSIKDKKEPQNILNGHFVGELWGLSTHKKENKFVTAGEDQLVRIWDIDSRKLLST